MTRILAEPAAVAFVCTLAVAGFHADGSAAQTLAPHRAVYDVVMKEASDRSGITSTAGRIVYEFRGSPCDGYTTNYRFVSRIRSANGDRLTDQQTTTFEDGTGETFRFVTKSFVDERLDHELAGSAVHRDDSTIITLKKPEEAEFTLGPALFPTAHIIDLLQRANAGETFYETGIYDGTDDGDRVMTTTVVLGPPTTGSEGDGENAGPLKGDSFRNVSIAYFDPESQAGGETLPEYQIAFKLYDNGVTRDLVMDYGDLVLTGALTRLDLLPQDNCR